MPEYRELKTAVERLQRNETRMTPEQKKQYAKQLKALRREISLLSYEVAQALMVAGMRVQKADGDECAERIAHVIEEEYKKGVLVTAAKTLLSTYSLKAFIKCLVPSQIKVWYEGYGPYWVSHCMPVDDRDNETAFTYYNDLIDMFWSPEWTVWKQKGEWRVSIMLPPTEEEISKEYAERLARLEDKNDRT